MQIYLHVFASVFSLFNHSEIISEAVEFQFNPFNDVAMAYVSIAKWDGNRDELTKNSRKKEEKKENLTRIRIFCLKNVSLFYPRLFLLKYFDILEILWSWCCYYCYCCCFSVYCFPSQRKKLVCMCVWHFFRSISLPLHIQIYDVLFWLSANAVLCITKTYLPKTHTRIHWFPVPWHWRNSEREREKGDRVKERISLCHLSQKTCGSKILCTHKNIYIAARSIGIWLRIRELCNKLLVVVVVAFFFG